MENISETFCNDLSFDNYNNYNESAPRETLFDTYFFLGKLS